MAAKVEVDFVPRGEDRLVRAYDAWEQSIARTNRRLVENGGTLQQQAAELRRVREAAREEVAAQRDANRVREQTKSAQQQYLEGSRRLQAQLNAGRISEQEYRQARNQLRLATIGLTQAERDQQAAAAKQQADQQTGEALTRRNATAVERYREQLRELRRLHQAGAIDDRTLARERARLRAETERETGAERRRNQALRDAEAVIERTRTADERYKAELQRLRQMLAAGTIDQQTFSRAVGQARDNLLGATTANQSLIGSIGRTAAVVTGVGSAVGGLLMIARHLRAEYDNLLERQGKSADVQEMIDRSVMSASKNTIGLMTPEELRAEAEKINADTNVPISSAAQIIGSAVTSTGVQNDQELELAKQAAHAAAAYAPEADVETQSAIAGVGASLAKRLRVSPEEAIGFMGKVGLQSNVADLESQVQNLAPALLSLVATGMDAQSSAALITAMTQEGDFTGETTATAVQNVVGELRDRFGKRFTDENGNFDAKAALDLIRTDADMRQKFLKGGRIDGEKFGEAALGKAKSRMAFERLVTPGTDAYQQFSSDRGNIDTVAAGGELFDNMVERNRRTARVFNMRRAFEGSAERLAANDPDAISGEFRRGMELIEKQAGNSAIGQRLSTLSRELQSDAGARPGEFAKVAIEQLRAEAVDLGNGEQGRYIPSSGMGGSPTYVPGRGATARERQIADELGRLADRLEQLLDTQPKERPRNEPAERPRVVVDLKPPVNDQQPVAPNGLPDIPARLTPDTPAPETQPASATPTFTESPATDTRLPATQPASATAAEVQPAADATAGMGEVTSLLQRQLDEMRRQNQQLIEELRQGRRDQATSSDQQQKALGMLVTNTAPGRAPLPIALPSPQPSRAALLGSMR